MLHSVIIKGARGLAYIPYVRRYYEGIGTILALHQVQPLVRDAWPALPSWRRPIERLRQNGFMLLPMEEALGPIPYALLPLSWKSLSKPLFQKAIPLHP